MTAAREGARLDGTLLKSYNLPNRDKRNAELSAIYDSPEKTILVCLVLVSVFQSFLEDTSFYLEGITCDGINPVD